MRRRHDGTRLTQLRVTHDDAGLRTLRRQLARFGDRIPIAIERSEGLQVEHLQAEGHALFAVSLRISARDAFYPGWTGSGVIESPRKVHEMWLLEAEAHHAESGCFVLTNHPFISGRPSKAAALEGLIEDVKQLDGMWVTTLAEIARHAAATVADTTVLPRIEAPTGYFGKRITAVS